MIPQPIDAVPLFVQLSDEERELVTARLSRHQASQGELLFSAGQPSEALFIITSGWVKLEDAHLERAITLANLGAGSLLGEVDTLLGRAYSTSARTATNTQLLVLARSDLADLIQKHPSIGLSFSAALGMRVAFLDPYLIQHRLRNIELLCGLSEEDLSALSKSLEFKVYPRGTTIAEAGTTAQAAFVIERGQTRVITKSGEGDSFEDVGEGALIGHAELVTGKPYAGTIMAIDDVHAWSLAQVAFRELAQAHPSLKLAFSRSLAASLSSEDKANAMDRMRQLPLFTDIPSQALAALAGRLVLRHFPANELIYADGAPGDALYIVETGAVKLLDCVFSDAQLLERVRAGATFGEMALMTGRTRGEAARAAVDTTVWVLYKNDYDDLMAHYPEIGDALSHTLSDRLQIHDEDSPERNLRRVELFSHLASNDLRAIASQIREKTLRPGEIVCFAGKPADTLYIVDQGEVKMIGVGPDGKPLTFALLGPGKSFGEQEIIQRGRYNATAQTIGRVQMWTIGKDDFLAMLEQYPLLAATVTRFMADQLDRTQPVPPPPQQPTRRLHPPQPSQSPIPQRGAPPPARGAAVQTGPSQLPQQHPPVPRPRPTAPTPERRFQQPLSGARPVSKTTEAPSPARTANAAESPNKVKMAGVAPIPRPGQGAAPIGSRPRPVGTAPSQNVPPPQQVKSGTVSPPMAAPSTWSGVRQATGVESPDAQHSMSPTARRRRRRTGPSFVDEFLGWLRDLSTGAKLRMAMIGVLSIWFIFIALPVTAIAMVSSAVGGLQILGGTTPSAAPAAATGTANATGSPVSKGLGSDQGTSTTMGKIAWAVATATPVPPTNTPIPRPTATPRPRPTTPPRTATPKKQVLPAAPPSATVPPPPPAEPAALAVTPTAPIPALPPVDWDPRLGSGPDALPHLDSVHIIPANVAHGQKFWRVVRLKFEDINESGNDHTIYVKVLDENGKRIDGKKAHLTSTGGLSEYPDEKPAGDLCDCNYNYPMFGDGYNFTIEDQYPSDTAAGMIMPMHRHVNYRVTFQLVTNP